jgi:hypothetical protein
MIIQDGKYVRTGNCLILWDGITRPETNEVGLVHSMKVACLATAPEIAELDALANKALVESEFKGVLPPGGNWPLLDCDPAKCEGKLVGHKEFNAKTYRGAPDVFDANRTKLDPMQYASMLYPGCVVQLLVHGYSFNNKSKGIAFGLDGIMIIDATAPRLPIDGGIDAGSVFGGAAPATPAPGMPAPAPGQVPPPHPGILTPPPAAPVHQMTPAAGALTYEQYIAAGWTHEQLVSNGFVVG